MRVLATMAVVVGVNMRARAQFRIALQQFSVMQTDVEARRNVNQSGKAEVEQLRNDPRAIQSAARANLNMVRSNEYVVPVD
jgi:cell division protein FtsB